MSEPNEAQCCFALCRSASSALQLLAVGGALRDAEMQRGHQHDLALAVEHVDLAAQRLGRIEDDAGGVDVAAVDVPVHREAGRTPLVGDRVLAARIEGHVHPLRLDVADVGELAGPDLVEDPLAGHDLDHVVARHRHVVGAELPRLERGQHRLVGIVGVHGHLDPVLGGELVEELLRDVLEPVIDRELPLGLRRAGQERQRHRHGSRFQICVHAVFSLWIGEAAPPASGMAVAGRIPPRPRQSGRRRRR